MSDFEIKPTRFGAPAAQTLLAAAQAHLVNIYGTPDENSVEAVEFDPPEGAFLVAYLGAEPVACGGWRTLSHFMPVTPADNATGDAAGISEDVAEIKRMYAVPSVRGKGVAAAVLSALEDSARASGMHQMVLETGVEQPDAVRFYRKCGYRQIPNYGHYKDEPTCVSFGRDL